MPTTTLEQTAASERAALESKPSPPPKPEASSKEQLKARVAEKLNQPLKAWERLAQDTSVDRKQSNLALKEKVGTIDEKGERVINSDRQKKLDRDNELYQPLLERGFDGLTPQQQFRAREEVRTAMLQTVEGQRMLAELGEVGFNKHIDGHLRNPDLLLRLKDQYKDLVDEPDEPNKIPETRKALAEARAAALKTAAGLARNQAEQRIAREGLAQYQDRSLIANSDGTPGQKGSKLVELEDLEKKYPQLKEQLVAKGAEWEKATRRLERLETQGGARYFEGKEIDPETQISQAEDKVIALRKEADDIQAQMNRREELIAERANLITKNGELEIEQVELEENFRNRQEDYSLAQTNYNDAKERREAQEDAFVGNFSRLLLNSSKEFLAVRMKKGDEIREAIEEEDLAKLTEDADKGVLIGSKSLFGRRKPIKGHAARTRIGRLFEQKGYVHGPYDQKTIDAYWDTLMGGNNPEAVLEASLRALKDKSGNRLLTDEQIAEKMKDAAWVEKMSPLAIEPLVRARRETHGITNNEALIIAESDWGPQVLEVAAAKNPDVQEQIEALKAQTGSKNMRELLAKLPGKSLLMLLLMILGSAVVSTLRGVNVQEALKEAA